MRSILQGDMQKVSYDTKLLPPGSPVRCLKKVPKVFIPSFFLTFLKKKRRLPQCRPFSFSVVPPTSLTYTCILIQLTCKYSRKWTVYKVAQVPVSFFQIYVYNGVKLIQPLCFTLQKKKSFQIKSTLICADFIQT